MIEISDLRREWTVCKWVKSTTNKFYVCSVCCTFENSILFMIGYFGRVIEHVGVNSVIFSVDANAISPLWYSKEGYSKHNKKKALLGKFL